MERTEDNSNILENCRDNVNKIEILEKEDGARTRPTIITKYIRCKQEMMEEWKLLLCITLIVCFLACYLAISSKTVLKLDSTDEAPENTEAEKETTQKYENPKTLQEKTIEMKHARQLNQFYYPKRVCSILDIFKVKAKRNQRKPKKETIKSDKPKNKEEQETDTATYNITVLAITIFLIVLVLNAILDVLKVKEEERVRRKLNPDGERRQSLAEFANKKSLRRESSKFGFQLFQIAESFTKSADEEQNRRQSRPYTRGDSTNSYLSEKAKPGDSAPASLADTMEPKLMKRQSVAKLLGARPAMTRRCSFPALHLTTDSHQRQLSVDSDDDALPRRVRIIRRF